ncbi:glucose-fructose oxidoreductase domain-containing protein 2 isoform X1 [Ischnura elegans]|uniref:glucose-fructose oxidoreductase domain-containing protein 2 isoform X1 n=1 Tax=Ischnura elegans TaxID=197161 RepID=UPI001ED8A313|nr:glucose-fructose oxidoreductase domain-containing protein 2 isoform X1 [Ischnura elegans]
MLPGIGVFGTGNVVKVIVPFLRAKGFKVEAIWGRTLSTAEDAAKELNIPFYTNKIDDVLLRKDVDLIFIICSPNLHAQIAVKALGIGKHVLCDKPAGLCQSESLKMVHASQYYPSLISILNHSLRFLPAFMQMRRAIKDGYVGAVNILDARVQTGSLLSDSYDWRCDDAMGGGILTLVGSHVIDLAAHLTGQRAVRVHAVLRTFSPATDRVQGIRRISASDFAAFQMELDGGALVTANLCSSSHLPGSFSQEVIVSGEKGQLTVRGGDLHGRRRVPDSEGGKCNPHVKEEVLYCDVEDLNQEGQAPTGAPLLPRPYLKGLFKMVGALREAFQSVEDRKGWVKEPVALAATFEDGQYVQAVIDALRRSSRNREWVKVNIVTEEPDPNPLLSAAVRRSAISM